MSRMMEITSPIHALLTTTRCGRSQTMFLKMFGSNSDAKYTRNGTAWGSPQNRITKFLPGLRAGQQQGVFYRQVLFRAVNIIVLAHPPFGIRMHVQLDLYFRDLLQIDVAVPAF